MARTKGATNKTTQSNSTEVVEKKVSNRGRKVGQVIEKEPAIIVTLNSRFRVKIDKLNKILQQKGKSENDEDGEDAGYKNLGYFNKWQYIAEKLIDILTKEKAGKKQILEFEEYKAYFEKSTKEVKKMFEKVDGIKFKIEEIA